jgi:hypothetical protein
MNRCALPSMCLFDDGGNSPAISFEGDSVDRCSAGRVTGWSQRSVRASQMFVGTSTAVRRTRLHIRYRDRQWQDDSPTRATHRQMLCRLDGSNRSRSHSQQATGLPDSTGEIPVPRSPLHHAAEGARYSGAARTTPGGRNFRLQIPCHWSSARRLVTEVSKHPIHQSTGDTTSLLNSSMTRAEAMAVLGRTLPIGIILIP